MLIFRARAFTLSRRVSGICCKSGFSLLSHLLMRFSMVAVMTMNVGYFMCVLAGLFIGELVVGRYTAQPSE